MTDLEIHEALLVAAKRARGLSDGARAEVLDELNRHKVGCRPVPWRDCPVIVHYAEVYEVDLAAKGAAPVPGPRADGAPGRAAVVSVGRAPGESPA